MINTIRASNVNRIVVHTRHFENHLLKGANLHRNGNIFIAVGLIIHTNEKTSFALFFL